MQKTLLLCFIHGFKGDDNTFAGFPKHLAALVSHALPQVAVAEVTYPTFETRGDLNDCVSRFREWLQNKVIDLEVAAGTPSPTIDPSVRVVLVGHSMGGIVAAETLLSIISDPPIRPPAPKSSTTNSSEPLPSAAKHGKSRSDNSATDSTTLADSIPSPSTFMFPYIQGLLAFDTPYLGISPSVVAHGAESHYKTASSAYSNLSELAGAFGWGNASKTPSPTAATKIPKGLPAGPESAKDALAASMTEDAAAMPAWQRWGKYAMFAGAAGAVAAGGAAAYMKREQLTEGWSWAGSHLEFVGCLVQGEELQKRLSRLVDLHEKRGIGFADIVTVLGKGATGSSRNEPRTYAGGWVEMGPNGQESSKRTFCNIPKKGKGRKCFEKAINDKAPDEIKAHMNMFAPREHPGYYKMSKRAKDLILGWVDEAWSESGDDKGDGKGEEEDMEAGLGGHALMMVDVDEGNVWRDVR